MTLASVKYKGSKKTYSVDLTFPILFITAILAVAKVTGLVAITWMQVFVLFWALLAVVGAFILLALAIIILALIATAVEYIADKVKH